MNKILEQIKNWYLRTFKADEKEIINNGYIKEEKDERDYIFGASDIHNQIIREDGQWSDIFTPPAERQNKRNVDVMACVTFSLFNVIEFLAFYKWGEKWDESDRYVAKMSNTTRNGNSMRQVIDTLRKISGSVPEEDYPFSDFLDWNKYYQSVPKNIIEKGQTWLKRYEVNYQAVLNNSKMMMEALKYSPLWVAGFAWAKSGEYYRSWGRTNHAFTIVGYKEGEYWLAFDSYSPFIKKLAWDYNFAYAKSISIKKKDIEFNKAGLKDLREKRGWKYIVLEEGYESINPGVYELLEDGIRYVGVIEASKIGILKLKEDKEVEGINKEDFVRILIK